MKTMKAMVMCMMLTLGISANAQSLSDILGAVASSATSTTTNDLVSGITSVFSSSKQADKNSIVGTWEYSEPALVFQSDNLLTKAGASLAAKKLESQLQTQFNKYGIKSGALTITFNSDGTFSQTLGTKTMNGQWKVKSSKLYITYLGVRTIEITTQISGNKLQFVTNANKLLALMKTMGSASSNTNIKTITSLMKSVNGMQAGITLVKKQ